MVRYKTEPGEKEQKILAEISLNTPNNLKRRKVTSAVSAVLCVIYAAFAVWMFIRGFVDNGFLLLGFAVLFLLIILFYKNSAQHNAKGYEKEKQCCFGRNFGICH